MSMKRIKVENGQITQSQVDEVVRVLKNDGVIIYPTDTVYGVGCLADSHVGANTIKKLKKRQEGNVFSVMVDSVESIKKYAVVGMMEEQFLSKYLPGPVTVVLRLKDEVWQSGQLVADVISPSGATGFRVINNYSFMNDICRELNRPIITTSANKSKQGQYESKIDFVLNQFADNLSMIDIIVDAGILPGNIPSTVVDLSKTPHTVLRRGAGQIPQEDLGW